ncbi:cobalt transporter [Maritimibacter sp. 55A14]|uniref:CbtA family protein n=1 Tax=Maritimibacter sp. 55A14 TaxID=2174844 RepID=UPI000D60DF29|nr:CbtA family protein [Maritimibacter sp. 55A14]PWE32991.1 cobalt transporter [Maritimibacter sp. 55A14]
MFKRMLAGGLIAGFGAGLFAAVLHFAFVQELILHAELYETGELVHFDTHAVGDESEAVSHDGHDHSHGDADGADTSALTRNVMTVLFTGLIYAGYGLILAAAYQVAGLFGRQISLQQGILWGIAGFACFQLAPAMGLAPELPGTTAADITLRQIWWLGTVLATGAGLALIGYGRSLPFVVGGAVLLALPHVIGAPVLDEFHGIAPPELAGEFSARVLGVGLAVWALLGWLTARFAAPEAA